MPFSPETKARMFIKSARICCLCYKQCGTNIEAAHIIAENHGGPNDDDNGIPVCFDCHQEIGSYDKSHPKGNKFTPNELKARRDKVYSLVDSGFLQAQIILNRIKSESSKTVPPVISQASEYQPNKEVKEILKLATMPNKPLESIPLKLKLLNSQDQAYVIDSLVDEYASDNNIEILLTIISNDTFSDKSLIILEQLLRRISITTDIQLKKTFLQAVSPEQLCKTDVGLRVTFFTEVIGILEMNQYNDVNKLTPVVPPNQKAIPKELLKRYLSALLALSRSGAWSARPVAQKTLLDLPESLIKILFQIFDDKFLLWYRDDIYKKILLHYKDRWLKSKIKLYSDYTTLSYKEFNQKWDSEEF